MMIDDLNPGDLVRLTKCDFPFQEGFKDKDIPIYCIKLNDSFPSAVIHYIDDYGHDRRYAVSPSDLSVVKHFDFSDKRWSWIATQGEGYIGDCYTIYNSPITKDARYRYLWQRWRSDGFYHCPYCDKALNNQKDIESDKDIEVKECDCEGWKKQEALYEKYLKKQDELNKLRDKILKGTKLDSLFVMESEQAKSYANSYYN